MKIRTDVRWLFADDLKPTGNVFEITGAEEIQKKTLIPVILLLGATEKGGVGEYQVSTWNITNLKELIAKLGDDSEKWKNFKVLVIPDGKKVKFQL